MRGSMQAERIADFEESKSVGDVGVNVVRQLLEWRKCQVAISGRSIDMLGVDLVFVNGDGVKFNAEVKTDAKLSQTGNFFIETYSNAETGRRGCIATMQAQYFVYVDPIGKKQYWSNAIDIKKNLPRWSESYETKSVPNKRGDVSFTTQGVCVPTAEYVKCVQFVVDYSTDPPTRVSTP